MQAVKWTYYGDDSTYTEAKASYGTKFASDNWMHKSMGIQLGLTDSIRCRLPEGTDGTGYWSLTIYALGYNDYTYTFQVSEDNIAQPKAADQKDIDALQAKVDEAKALNEVNYTADSWSSMKTELDESEDLLKKESLLSAEVKTQLQHMTDALERLVQKEADLTNLTEAIQKAEAANYNEADYTADSWKVYADALAAAKALTTSEDVLLQSDVNTATENLNAAINALVKAETPSDPDEEGVSTTALEKAITTASELKESDYTADSWKAFQTAFTNAKAAMEAKESQEAVDAATENLNAAVKALVKAETPSNPTDPSDSSDQEVVSTTALEKAIAAVGELKESDYTADSWKALQNALDAAKAVLSEKKDQATVDAATENLNTAVKALAKAETSETLETPETPEKPENSDTASDSDQEVVSITALEKAIAAASELKETDYTADSWKALQDALSVAKTALDEKKDQATVDTSTENLNKAISALVKSGSTETKKTSTATTEDKKTSGTGTSATSGSVQTGDPTSVFGWLALAVSSLGVGGLTLKKRKRREDVE